MPTMLDAKLLATHGKGESVGFFGVGVPRHRGHVRGTPDGEVDTLLLRFEPMRLGTERS